MCTVVDLLYSCYHLCRLLQGMMAWERKASLFTVVVMLSNDQHSFSFQRCNNLPCRPLQRMVVGMLLAGLSFSVAGVVQLFIQNAGNSLKSGEGKVAITNTVPDLEHLYCQINATKGNDNKSFSLHHNEVSVSRHKQEYLLLRNSAICFTLTIIDSLMFVWRKMLLITIPWIYNTILCMVWNNICPS